MLSDKNNVELGIGDIINIIKPYILHLVFVFLIFSMCSYIFTCLLIQPVYQSSATVIVNNRRKDATAITGDEINSAKNLASVYSIIIKSNAVMEPVIEELNVDLSNQDLSSKVSVSAIDNTQVIKISVTDPDREMARNYVNEIIKVAPDIIVEKVEAGDIKIVSYPQVSRAPISPNIKMNVLLSGVVGVMLSLGIVILRYFLDATFKSPKEIENALGIPLLGVIPNSDSVHGHK